MMRRSDIRACEDLDGGAVMAQASEESAVNAAVEALTKAMLQADKAELERLVADQLSYWPFADAQLMHTTTVGAAQN
jgi:hypothetical protein